MADLRCLQIPQLGHQCVENRSENAAEKMSHKEPLLRMEINKKCKAYKLLDSKWEQPTVELLIVMRELLEEENNLTCDL